MVEFDPGPPPDVADHLDRLPSYAAHQDLFWYDWGPIFYRGRLDRSARLLCIASDPGPTERIAGRTLRTLEVPTTLLAQQHHNTFSDRFAGYPIRVEMLSRFLTPAQARLVIKGLATGEVMAALDPVITRDNDHWVTLRFPQLVRCLAILEGLRGESGETLRQAS